MILWDNKSEPAIAVFCMKVLHWPRCYTEKRNACICRKYRHSTSGVASEGNFIIGAGFHVSGALDAGALAAAAPVQNSASVAVNEGLLQCAVLVLVTLSLSNGAQIQPSASLYCDTWMR